MKHLTALLLGLIKFGGPGLLILGILDSSFLVAPFGNDLLVVAMTARTHSTALMLYYAGMSTVGSILGCLVVDLVMRGPGEHGLEKHLARKRLDYVKRKVQGSAAWALVIASIAPPPFPFTPFVMAAAALQYPRARLLSVVGVARMARFTALGVAALYFGTTILHWAKSPILIDSMIGLIVVSIVASVISVYGWIKRSRSVRGNSRSTQEHAPRPALR